MGVVPFLQQELCETVIGINLSKTVALPPKRHVPTPGEIAVVADIGIRINPFRTAVPFGDKTTQIPSSLSPKRDCGPKRGGVKVVDSNRRQRSIRGAEHRGDSPRQRGSKAISRASSRVFRTNNRLNSSPSARWRGGPPILSEYWVRICH